MKLPKKIRQIPRKKLFLISVLLVVTLAVSYYFFSAKKKIIVAPKITVTVAKAFEDEIFDNVEALGTSLANESVTITPTITETVDQIRFTDNQIVKKGDVIVVLQYREEMAQKKAEELQLKEHQRELQRLTVLLRNQAVNKQKYDERKTLIDISRQKISEIEATIEDRIIRAPFDGVLGLRNVSVGSVVRSGDVITTIDDIKHIKIDFAIPETYLGSIYPKMPIKATTEAFPGRAFDGQVSFIDSRADEKTRSVKVRAVIENNDLKLRPGLLMSVKLLKNKRKAVMIPEETITQQQSQHFVFTVSPENIVAKKEVEIGLRKPGFVEIKRGITVGDLVITRGITRVSDGQEVDIEFVGEDKKPEIDSKKDANSRNYKQRNN